MMLPMSLMISLTSTSASPPPTATSKTPTVATVSVPCVRTTSGLCDDVPVHEALKRGGTIVVAAGRFALKNRLEVKTPTTLRGADNGATIFDASAVAVAAPAPGERPL